MEEKKYHVEKNTVQETLIIPLYGRKVCSERFPELFQDPEAERICNGLDYDFAEKGKKMQSGFGLFGALEVAQRQYDLAYEVKEYLKVHPRANVVNLGCGLDDLLLNVIMVRAGGSTWICRTLLPSAMNYCRQGREKKTLEVI